MGQTQLDFLFYLIAARKKVRGLTVELMEQINIF